MNVKSAVGIALGVLLAAGTLSAQRGGPDPLMRIWTGVYAEAQAERGKTSFAVYCSTCHKADLSGGANGSPAIAGAPFMAKWELETLATLYQTVKDQSTRANAGMISDAAAADVLAYVLKGNGFPAASNAATSLSTDPDVLDTIVLVPQSGPTKIPNFALVQVTGCLIARDSRTWMLAQSTTPVSAKDVPTTDADLQTTKSRPAGTETFRLVSAGPFAPAQHAGERVFVKGIINRVKPDPLLNVTALQTLGDRCTN